MREKKPTPFSPEGKRAAERIRTIFFSIAAANIVLAAIVMWHRHTADKKRDAEPPKPAALEK